MEKKKFEIFKAPIMATVIVARLIPGIPSYNNRFLFYITVVLPFLPIFKYAESTENETLTIAVFPYLIFYLISNILLVRQIKKLGGQWKTTDYSELTHDQITFPFILVMMVNATIHFGLFYLISKFIIR